MASGDGMAQEGNETSATTCWLGTSTNLVTVVWTPKCICRYPFLGLVEMAVVHLVVAACSFLC